jgi:hypothetical protein
LSQVFYFFIFFFCFCFSHELKSEKDENKRITRKVNQLEDLVSEISLERSDNIRDAELLENELSAVTYWRKE